ncbi:MAG: prolyl oligopeptidase family serine peptidase [Gemmatimonadaceae bacterium]
MKGIEAAAALALTMALAGATVPQTPLQAPLQTPLQRPLQTPLQAPLFNKQRVTYKNGALTLVGFSYHPNGAGPFPTVVWNHGSEKNPGTSPQFDSVAAIFVPAGYAVFAPMRRGHGNSEGTYIVDSVAKIRETDKDGALKLTVHLLETEQLEDQFAGINYVKTLSFVDTAHMVVTGCSYGGIQTLLAAERGGGFKAAMPISPAAQSWEGNALLRARMETAVRKINMPVLLIQPPKDASLRPAKELGDAAKKFHKTNFTAKIYAATMPDSQQTHCFGGAKGFRNFATEAITFFNGALGRKSAQ